MIMRNKEELVFFIQTLLAIFICYTTIRFFNVFAANYHFLPAIGVIFGAAIIYFFIRKNRHFDVFFGALIILAMPVSLLYFFTAV